MPAINYPKEQMHRIRYTKLTKEGLSLNSMAAYARTAGYFDVKRFFGPKRATERQ
jgi:hypothetical protein